MNRSGKKYIVLSPETYEMLTRNQKGTNNDYNNNNNINNNTSDIAYVRNQQIQEMLQPPEKLAMLKAGEEMKNVWTRSDLSQDEKIKHYTNQMNQFKMLYKGLSTPTPIEMKLKKTNNQQQSRSAAIAADASPATAAAPLEKSLKVQEDEKDLTTMTTRTREEGDTFSQYGIIGNLPRSMKKTGELLEDYLKQYPDKVNWNHKGELIFRGETIKGTNISNLF